MTTSIDPHTGEKSRRLNTETVATPFPVSKVTQQRSVTPNLPVKTTSAIEVRSQALADSVMETVRHAQEVDPDLVFNTLFKRIGQERLGNGELLNRIIREICNDAP